jgi:hypothetical protein
MLAVMVERNEMWRNDVSNYIVAAGNDEETGLGGNRSVAKMT